ncbi:MAG: YybH family protein [Blastocatellia bacterium]
MTPKQIIAALILTLFAAAISSISAQEKSKPVPADNLKVEITAFLDKWNIAIANSDLAAIRSAYVSDARFQWFQEGVLKYRSSSEIVEQRSKYPKETAIVTKLSDIEVRLLNDQLAYGSVAFKTKLSMPTDSFEFSGMFTMLLEKTDGHWKFVSGHTSTVPPPTPGRK